MINKLANIAKLKNEIVELENWFKKYDVQAIQYQRDLRVKCESAIDINALDKEAYVKAARIKELRNSIKEIEDSIKGRLANLKK